MLPKDCECRLWVRGEGQSLEEHHPRCQHRPPESWAEQIKKTLDAQPVEMARLPPPHGPFLEDDDAWVRWWAGVAIQAVTSSVEAAFDLAERMLAEAKAREARRAAK